MTHDHTTNSSLPIIALVEAQGVARRTAVIQAACADLYHQDSNPFWSAITVKSITPTHSEDVCQTIRKIQPQVVCVVIEEERLAFRALGEQHSKYACHSIAIGYDLLKTFGKTIPIYFVAPPHIVGAEVLTLLQAGAKGVLDERSLGSCSVIKSIFPMRSTSLSPLQLDRELQTIITGVPHDRLAYLKRWAHDSRIAEPHWALVVAFAQIPLPRFVIDQGRKSASAIAVNLNTWQKYTNYVPNTSTRRQIGITFEIVRSVLLSIMEMDEEDVELDIIRSSANIYLSDIRIIDNNFKIDYLPTYARMLGLPSISLPMLNLSDRDQAITLHRVLESLNITKLNPVDEMRRGRVSF